MVSAPPSSVPDQLSFRGIVGLCVHAVQSRWQTLLLIQGAAFGFVISYYQSPALQEWAAGVGEAKVAGGIWFLLVAGVLAGAVVPDLAKVLTGKLRRFDRAWVSRFLTAAFVYATLSVVVDVFYIGLARVFGEGVDVGTILAKVTVDMLLFSPLLAVPYSVAAFRWRLDGFQVRALPYLFSWSFYRREVVPVLAMTWVFWIPMLMCVYALPLDLQFTFSRFTSAAWSVILVFMTTGHEEN